MSIQWSNRWIWLAGIFLVGCLLSILWARSKSSALAKITLTAIDPKLEPRDFVLPGFGDQKDAAPDYSLIVIGLDGREYSLGTKANRSAVDGIVFSTQRIIPAQSVGRVRLLENDAVSDDPIEEIFISNHQHEQGNYRIQLEYQPSPSLMVQHLLTSTPVGLLLLCIMVVAVFLFFVNPIYLVSWFLRGRGDQDR